MLLSKKLYTLKKKDKFIGSWNFGPSEKKISNAKEIANNFFKSIKLYRKIHFNKKKLYNEKKILFLNSNKSFKMLKWKQKINTINSISLCASWYLNYIKKNRNLMSQQIKDSKLFN